MEISKKRIRIDYAPLNVAVSVVNITPNSPVVQVYNGFTNQYEPNRALSPTVILPQVVASAVDNSWGDPHSNHALADMKWYVDGTDISTLPEWENLYSINQNGSLRGAISIMRNFSPGEQVSLHFEGVLVDNRLGVNIPIKTEPIVLSCSDKSQNMYSLSIGDDQIIQYNPFKDKLFLYEYKVSHGLLTASTAAQNAATDENAYNRVIPVTLFSGDKVITTGYNIKLFRVNSATSFTEIAAGTDEIIAISPTQITLDLRLIHKSDYVIRAYAENREVAMVQFSVNRVNPRYTIRMTNGTDISPFDTMRYDEVMVDYDGNVVDCPGSIIRILWYSDTYAKTNVLLNEGDVTQFLLALTGIGSSYNDSWIELHTESELKEAHSIATDETGEIFTDENGNELIFN